MSFWNNDSAWRNPHRLYRDTDNARLAGVCAGIADYFGFRRSGVRVAALVCLVFFSFATIITYIALAIVLPKKPARLYANPDEEVFWRGVATAPDDTLRQLNHHFSTLERRLAAMERTVTSPEFDLHRKFRDIGG